VNTYKLGRKIECWEELTNRQQLFEQEGQEWVFRGQGNPWQLRPSLERAVEEFKLDFAKVPRLENDLITEFVRRYHLYAVEQPPLPGDTLDWLALMRHHGAPTRLLDFTFSFQIAAYFALEEATGRPTVCAVNKTWLTSLVAEWAAQSGKDVDEALLRFSKSREGEAFRKLFLNSESLIVSPVSPFRLNQRLTVQMGIFLCPGDVRNTFQKNLEACHGYKENVINIPISPDKGRHFLRLLDQAGVNRASLFPGLDGFAQSLRPRMLLLSHLMRLEGTARGKNYLDYRSLERRQDRGI
jgi:hypothetical protein